MKDKIKPGLITHDIYDLVEGEVDFVSENRVDIVVDFNNVKIDSAEIAKLTESMNLKLKAITFKGLYDGSDFDTYNDLIIDVANFLKKINNICQRTFLSGENKDFKREKAIMESEVMNKDYYPPKGGVVPSYESYRSFQRIFGGLSIIADKLPPKLSPIIIKPILDRFSEIVPPTVLFYNLCMFATNNYEEEIKLVDLYLERLPDFKVLEDFKKVSDSDYSSIYHMLSGRLESFLITGFKTKAGMRKNGKQTIEFNSLHKMSELIMTYKIEERMTGTVTATGFNGHTSRVKTLPLNPELNVIKPKLMVKFGQELRERCLMSYVNSSVGSNIGKVKFIKDELGSVAFEAITCFLKNKEKKANKPVKKEPND